MSSEVPSGAGLAVTRQIERFLKGLERAKRQPNRREAFHARAALEYLDAGQVAEAQEAIARAERAAPLPGHVANLVATNRQYTVAELTAELQRIAGADGRAAAAPGGP